MNAASLMLVTPEYFKVLSVRKRGASKINYEPANFVMKPIYMQLDGVKIRYAKAGNPDGPTVLFLGPLPQSILCYDKIWAAMTGDANLVALDMPGFGRSEGDMSYMTFAAQSAFLEKFVSAMGLTGFHIVAPDVAMPVALHYVMHRDHKAKSLLIGDGPGILPSLDGSLIKKNRLLRLLAVHGQHDWRQGLHRGREPTGLSPLQPFSRGSQRLCRVLFWSGSTGYAVV